MLNASSQFNFKFDKHLHRSQILKQPHCVFQWRPQSLTSVSIAQGKYLYPFRTQKSSLVAAIILLRGKLARCRIIQIGHLNGWPFVCPNEIWRRSKATRIRWKKAALSDCEAIAYLYNDRAPQPREHYTKKATQRVSVLNNEQALQTCSRYTKIPALGWYFCLI